MKQVIRCSIVMMLVLAIIPFAAPASEDYPSKEITYQITFSPGGASDRRARMQQPRLEKLLGEKIVIQYKPGGGGSIGWANLVKQKPDGYFISGINIPHIVIQPIAREDPGYQTGQIEPIILFQQIPFGLVVPKDSPFETLEDLVDYAQKRPGALTIGGSGTWDATQMAHFEFEKLIGSEITYVPHKGGKPKQSSLLGGHTKASWFGVSEVVANEDKVRFLAVGTEERTELYPDVPTFKEEGYDLLTSVYHGVGVPPGTPDEVKQTLQEAFFQIAEDPEVQKEKLEDGFTPIVIGPSEAEEIIDDMTNRFKPIIEKHKE